jgi:hypothetical protein
MEETRSADQYVKEDDRALMVCLTLNPYTASMKLDRIKIELMNPAQAK